MTPIEMQVVYQQEDSYDMNSGPFGYTKVGFRFNSRVVWISCVGAYMPNGNYTDDEKFCKELVRRWNEGESK